LDGRGGGRDDEGDEAGGEDIAVEVDDGGEK